MQKDKYGYKGYDLSLLKKKGDIIAGKVLTDEINDTAALNDLGEVAFVAECDGGLCEGSGVTLPGWTSGGI